MGERFIPSLLSKLSTVSIEAEAPVIPAAVPAESLVGLFRQAQGPAGGILSTLGPAPPAPSLRRLQLRRDVSAASDQRQGIVRPSLSSLLRQKGLRPFQSTPLQHRRRPLQPRQLLQQWDVPPKCKAEIFLKLFFGAFYLRCSFSGGSGRIPAAYGLRAYFYGGQNLLP